MTSLVNQRTKSILAIFAIVFLVILLTFIWVGYGNGVFKGNKENIDVSESVTIDTIQGYEPYDEERQTILPATKSETKKDVEYVKPVKISPLPLHQHDIIYEQNRHGGYESNEPQPLRHHSSGHFRSHVLPVWDPHPQYTFKAFGNNMHLRLTHNSHFVPPTLQISHISKNDTSRTIDPGLQTDGCFYSGHVEGDDKSSVAVSLCNGMTGYIRTKAGTYYIKPVEPFRNHTSPILHTVRRAAWPGAGLTVVGHPRTEPQDDSRQLQPKRQHHVCATGTAADDDDLQDAIFIPTGEDYNAQDDRDNSIEAIHHLPEEQKRHHIRKRDISEPLSIDTKQNNHEPSEFLQNHRIIKKDVSRKFRRRKYDSISDEMFNLDQRSIDNQRVFPNVVEDKETYETSVDIQPPTATLMSPMWSRFKDQFRMDHSESDEMTGYLNSGRSHAVEAKANHYQNIDRNYYSHVTPRHPENQRKKGRYNGQHKSNMLDFDRKKREDGQEFFVEIMIIADKSMLDTHKTKENLIHYILTLMSHVALLFKDPSIGNPISISMAGIHILDHYFYGTSSDLIAKQRLSEFCQWQANKQFNHTYDTAMLLTRSDLCANDCRTLGIANIGSMCNKYESCSLVKDKGLSTSFTIAHELGHMLSMLHDQDCGKKYQYRVNNIMTKMMDNDTVPWQWSTCSKTHLTEFLDSPRSSCLMNHPKENYLTNRSDIERRLPGEDFNREKQCELMFGKGWIPCDGLMYSCEMLTCMNKSDGICHTPFVPWADGTVCGLGKWCHRGRCIPVDAKVLTPIIGGWSGWGEWSECSLTCGGGIRKSIRECDRPRPAHGGSYCVGRPVKYESCNTDQCPVVPGSNSDPREAQCARWNGNNRGIPGIPKDVKWIPKYGVSNGHECKLNCRIEHTSDYYPLEQKVIDGAKCQLNGFDVCVNGMCVPAGCDNIIGSNVTLDRCGKCGGNGSSCRVITGSMLYSTKYGYNHVVRIPKGARSLNVVQKGVDGSKDVNYLALVDSKTRKYILNGNSYLVRQKTIAFAGVEIDYSGSTSIIERLNSSVRTALKEDLIVEVLSVDLRFPPNVSYSYVVAVDHLQDYEWTYGEWTSCNSICEGTRTRLVHCVHTNERQISPADICAQKSTSLVLSEPCNTECKLRWEVISKDECSVHCGNGRMIVHYECVKFSKNEKRVVSNKECALLPEPPKQEPCVGPCNQLRWDYGVWSECSVTCGKGVQSRSATCVDKNNNKLKPEKCKDIEKRTETSCDARACPQWAVNIWTPCSVTCGQGIKRRLYYCHIDNRIVPNEKCDQEDLPKTEDICMEASCTRWDSSDWKPCSVTCGMGYVNRDVFCKEEFSGKHVDESLCPEDSKPDTVRTCELHPCATSLPATHSSSTTYSTTSLAAHPTFIPSSPMSPGSSSASISDRSSSGWNGRRQHTHYNSISGSASREDNNIDNSINVYRQDDIDYTWRTGSWTQCSQTCGSGHKTRRVFCEDEDGREAEGKCNEGIKPLGRVECNYEPCPTWNSGAWSKCDSNCYKNRQIRCQNYRGDSLPHELCSVADKPSHATLCEPHECILKDTNKLLPSPTYPVVVSSSAPSRGPRKYKWMLTGWSKCSKPCGQGTRTRTMFCAETSTRNRISNAYCEHLRKPTKTVRNCIKKPCVGFSWVPSTWSKCSASCGEGVQTRTLSCQRVNKHGHVEPALPGHCSRATRPLTTQSCKHRNCNDLYYWRVGDWKPCHPDCGHRRRQERNLYCYHRDGKKVAKPNCPPEFKPPRRRKCEPKKCGYVSCSDLKKGTGVVTDHDYTLLVHGKNVSIYCHQMASEHPVEYLTLQHDNYAEYFDKTLKNPQTCPYDGERPNLNCDMCIDSDIYHGGFTEFKRVRLNINTLQVITDDWTFARQRRGHKHVQFGQAGDCYSATGHCAQGRFEINLRDTGFRVNTRRTRWISQGRRVKMDVRKEDPQRIIGRCGGHCGNCTPDASVGLLLEVT